MNEQVQQLATRAGLYVDSNGRPYPQALSAEQANAALQKFAELIVRECADLAYKFDGLTMGQGYTVAKHMKKHFGVEE